MLCKDYNEELEIKTTRFPTSPLKNKPTFFLLLGFPKKRRTRNEKGKKALAGSPGLRS